MAVVEATTGELVARLLARPDFSKPHAKPRDLANARALLEAVTTAVIVDDPKIWKQLASVRTQLEQVEGIQERRSRCLEAVEALRSIWWRPNLEAERGEGLTLREIHDELAAGLARDLAHYEPRFAKLGTKAVVSVFARKRGAEMLAAELACVVSAFGDRNKKRSRGAFVSAKTGKTKPKRR